MQWYDELFLLLVHLLAYKEQSMLKSTRRLRDSMSFHISDLRLSNLLFLCRTMLLVTLRGELKNFLK